MKWISTMTVWTGCVSNYNVGRWGVGAEGGGGGGLCEVDFHFDNVDWLCE